MRKRLLVDAAILEAVDQGLSSDPKSLPSWLFYDASGDKIFQAIMSLPEYYPTRCELKIFEMYKDDLREYFAYDNTNFELLELGAGDGMKTKVLLKHFVQNGLDFRYRPVDVSGNVLQQLNADLSSEIDGLRIDPIVGRYEDVLSNIATDNCRKVILFIGANIGNYAVSEAQEFLRRIADAMAMNDFVLIGFDLKKDPRIIQKAYDDSKGVTAEFNLNLLTRLNEELGADFDVYRFQHFPVYDPLTGAAKSYLVSRGHQDVYIEALRKTFHFKPFETIYTEISQKYDDDMIYQMSENAGLQIVDTFIDAKKYFCDILFRKSSRK